MTTGSSPNRRSLMPDEGGAAALLFALALPVVLGFGALVVDIGNARLVRGQMQSAADAAALAASQILTDKTTATARAVTYATNNVPPSYGDVAEPSDVEFGFYDAGGKVFTPGATATNAVRVTLHRDASRGNAIEQFFAPILGVDSTTLTVSAVAARFLRTTYGTPILKDRGFEAGDYNEIYAYCYDSATKKRTSEVLIHRNITPAVTIANWPSCSGSTQAMSFRLRNIRDSRATVQSGGKPKGTEYNYYSDTTRDSAGSESFTGFGGKQIIETMRCATETECQKISKGGVIPEGKNRTPNIEKRPCVPGSYMYYGWEDRPPGSGWTDADYNDITFILKCTANGTAPEGPARLVL